MWSLVGCDARVIRVVRGFLGVFHQVGWGFGGFFVLQLFEVFLKTEVLKYLM